MPTGEKPASNGGDDGDEKSWVSSLFRRHRRRLLLGGNVATRRSDERGNRIHQGTLDRIAARELIERA